MSLAGRQAVGLTASLKAWAQCTSVLSLLMLGWLGPTARAQTTAPATPAADTAPANTTAAGGDFLALQRRYIELLGQATPAMVKIKILASDGITYLSTGFFISREGYIITANAHLLQDAVRIVFEHDGVAYIADLVGVDLVTNIALLRAPKVPPEMGVLNLTDSPGLPPIGTMLLAVTCKRGDDPGPSPGILQGYNVRYGDQNLHALYMRSNIPDDGAESGSPVFDLTGQLVGLMVVTLPATRSSLVLPTRALMRVREDLLNHGKVQYGHFGFSGTQLVTAETRSQVMVDDVEYGGPASKAGLRVGDLLISMDGTPIHADQDMIQSTFFARPGQYITLRVRREGHTIDIPLEVGEPKPEAPPPANITTSAAGTSTAAPAASGNTTGAPDGNLTPPVVLPSMEKPEAKPIPAQTSSPLAAPGS